MGLFGNKREKSVKEHDNGKHSSSSRSKKVHQSAGISGPPALLANFYPSPYLANGNYFPFSDGFNQEKIHHEKMEKHPKRSGKHSHYLPEHEEENYFLNGYSSSPMGQYLGGFSNPYPFYVGQQMGFNRNQYFGQQMPFSSQYGLTPYFDPKNFLYQPQQQQNAFSPYQAMQYSDPSAFATPYGYMPAAF